MGTNVLALPERRTIPPVLVMNIARRITGLVGCALAFSLLATACTKTAGPAPSMDVLGFYSKLTAVKSVYAERVAREARLPRNLMQCSAKVHSVSDYRAYYGLEERAHHGFFDTYDEGSEFAAEVTDFSSMLEEMMNLFHDSGFVNEVSQKGLKPALMFDIDNTLEFCSVADDDFRGDGPAIAPMVQFVKDYCFDRGVDCYFITARYCTEKSANSTATWLKNNLGYDDDRVEEFTFLMGSVGGCAGGKNQKIAYKDALREVISQKRGAYWLMSIGDQLTDILGTHSGLKMWEPNQAFQADGVPNVPVSSDPETSCRLTEVVAPTAECVKSLAPELLQKTAVTYCAACAESEECKHAP